MFTTLVYLPIHFHPICHAWWRVLAYRPAGLESLFSLLSREECAENRCLDLCLQVSWDGPLCCLLGADVFLNPFFKWSCCTACHDRWTEDKVGHVAWPSPKLSVCSLTHNKEGIVCGCPHSFLVVRWYWWGALRASHLTKQAYIVNKMWYLIFNAPGCAYLEEIQI